jgi:hypothetical protein
MSKPLEEYALTYLEGGKEGPYVGRVGPTA